MSNAQKELADFNRYLDSRGARVHPDEESFCEGFERGYAAASAERDRLQSQIEALEERIQRMTEHGVGAAALAAQERE